ncbi:N-acetylmuramoyl-L-alanine amidase [Propionispira arboris]|uniref:N-acetylmuramoyl-L-alanine amidase n=1 Tax=Propionispira arboris TaxID=84035 RepID=A0A1H6UP92_9FIRM|nr:N-acetylmuramoyl-L-alanine amidase [Propionispira arboris]
MNRRKFLIYTFYIFSFFYLFPEIIASTKSFAGVRKINNKSPFIKETYLKFASPLVDRSETNMIIIHHIGGTDRDVSAAEVHQWHLDNGWAGIGYHYIIRKNGTIERGRPQNVIGAHCYHYNRTSIGINLVGDFEKSKPTEEQIQSALELTTFLCKTYNLSPTNKTILGHRDLSSTLCPGKNLYAQLGAFRQCIVDSLA